MRIFRTVVVAVLLGAFFSPAVGLAKTEPRVAPAVTQPVSGAAAAPAEQLDQLEQQRRRAIRAA